MVLFFFACLYFKESTSLKELWSKVAAKCRKGVVFTKIFVLRSTGNELVLSPLLSWSLNGLNSHFVQ